MIDEVAHEEHAHPRERAAALAHQPTVLRGYNLRRGVESGASGCGWDGVGESTVRDEDGRQGDDGGDEGE
jgi:hypothetical protein